MPELLGDMIPAEFARRMNVVDSTVSRWIKGERDMSYEHAVQASFILNCHAEDMYEWIVIPKGERA